MSVDIVPRYAITIEQVPDEVIASVTRRATLDSVGDETHSAFVHLSETIAGAGLFGPGPPGLIVREMDDGVMTVEIFMPVASEVEVGDVRTRTLSGGKVVTTMHKGPYDRIGPAYQALTAWIADHREVGAGPPRERYLNDPFVEGATPRARVEFPIA